MKRHVVISGCLAAAFSLTAAGRTKLKAAMTRWMSAQQEFEAQVGPTRAARIRTDLLALELPA